MASNVSALDSREGDIWESFPLRDRLFFSAVLSVPVVALVISDIADFIAGYGLPIFGIFLAVVNVAFYFIFLWRAKWGVLGLSVCSLLLAAIPKDFVGASSTQYLFAYLLFLLIVYGRWLELLLSFLVFAFVAYSSVQEYPVYVLISSSVLVILISFPLGFVSRLYLSRRDEYARGLSEMQDAVANQFSMAIHDTALTSLTREILRIRELAANTNDASVYTELMSIEEGLRLTSQSLREVFNTTESQDSVPESFNIVCADIDLLMRASSHSLHLENEVNGLEDLLSRDQYRFLLLVLKEGALNATKYAPKHSEITLSISQSAQGVEASVVSLMPEKVSADHGLSSRIGIENLRKRAEVLGVDFFSGPVNGQWLHTLSIPYVECRAVDAVEEGKGAESESEDGT